MKRKLPQATCNKPKAKSTFKLNVKPGILASIAAVLVIVTALASLANNMPDESTPTHAQVAIELPPSSTTPAIEAASASSKTETSTYIVKTGDNLSTVLNRAGISKTAVHQLAYKSTHGKSFRNLKPGQKIHVAKIDDAIKNITYWRSAEEQYQAIFKDAAIHTSHIKKQPNAYPVIAFGTINESFYTAGIKAGLPDSIIMELANIFGWDIDFAKQIRKNDQFSVVYEQIFIDGQYLRTGNILAAEFINKGKSFQAVRFKHKNGTIAFYTPKGTSLKKTFLRTPLDSFRISSKFNPKRKHPILNTIRAHKGTDYAAPRGTPIKAVGDGKILFSGRSGGAGKMVKIDHGQGYQTRYAHLDRFARNIKKGRYVSQGQIIGYVGSTGLATGPHLHYEFHLNGSVRNPETVTLPSGRPIQRSNLKQFQKDTANLVSMLKTTKNLAVAQAQFSGTGN